MSYDNEAGAGRHASPASRSATRSIAGVDGARACRRDDAEGARTPRSRRQLADALKAAGYPAKADPAQINKADGASCILTVLVIYVTMVYGPIAAMLVELFPTRIRYTSMSLPYHIGNGWFGGFLPTTAFAIVAATGNIYYGLWYPIVVAADDLRDRHAVRARDQGRGHLRRRLISRVLTLVDAIQNRRPACRRFFLRINACRTDHADTACPKSMLPI